MFQKFNAWYEMEKVSMCLNLRIESGYINFQKKKDNGQETDLKQMSNMLVEMWIISTITYQFTLTPGANATKSYQPNCTYYERNRHQEYTKRHWAWGRETKTERDT